MNKQVCVIGMGRYGSTIARELYQSGHDVLAIDSDEARIQDQMGHVTYAVRADATNEAVLKELDLPDYDVAIVALGGDNVQASVSVTALLKSLGIPMVMARAANDQHGDILERIGADRVLFPEAENARRVAKLEFTRELLDYMPILADYGISKIRPPEGMLNKRWKPLDCPGLATVMACLCWQSVGAALPSCIRLRTKSCSTAMSSSWRPPASNSVSCPKWPGVSEMTQPHRL